MKTADRFKELRGKMKMSQAQLAEFLEMSPGSIYKYEKGQHIPRVDILEKMEVFVNNKVVTMKGELKLENQTSKTVISDSPEYGIDANYVLGLQKNEIERLRHEINVLKTTISLNDATISKNPIWEELDYDVMTTQIYETDTYAYFESYEIIRHHTFFKKLGYSEVEADVKYKELKRTVDANIQHPDLNFVDWLFENNVSDDNMIHSWKNTKEFFLASKKKNMINALEMFKVTYKHKDGSSIPAIINVLYDFKGDSSISKIKFIDN